MDRNVVDNVQFNVAVNTIKSQVMLDLCMTNFPSKRLRIVYIAAAQSPSTPMRFF